jgi:hypothetical protein
MNLQKYEMHLTKLRIKAMLKIALEKHTQCAERKRRADANFVQSTILRALSRDCLRNPVVRQV